MMYWIIEIVLLVLILATIIVTVVTIVKEKKEYKHLELDAHYGMDDDEDEYDDRPAVRRRKSTSQQDPPSARNTDSKKRRWKIILEDTDTEERYSYIFYNNIGIGRTTKEAAYENFLSLPEDRKVSKVHCSIMRSQDKLYLKDEGSRNFTFLNGKKIQKPVAIQKDDIISIGETDLEVVKVLRETK